jgi:hypothetical protein
VQHSLLLLLKFAVLEYSFNLVDIKGIANWFTFLSATNLYVTFMSELNISFP